MTRLISLYKSLLRENVKWLLCVTVLFFIAIAAGVAAFFYDSSLLDYISQVFEEKFGFEPGLDFNLVKALFVQNLTAALVALFGGIVFGIAPLAVIALNGFLLGYVASAAADSFLIVAGLLPHAIFELPAILIAAALGFKLGLRWLGGGAVGSRLAAIKQDFKTALLFLPLIILLVFLAALMEVYVSAKLLSFL